MARSRNIKPGFFRNADLADLPVEARLLFIGLWTLADRDGRLEDRPKQIKMEIFPADCFDCDLLIDSLAATGMVDRYEVDGRRYLHVVNFTKHQNPHRDERASTIPGQIRHCAPTSDATELRNTSTMQAQCEHHASTVQVGLIPDTLIPDTLIPETNTSAAGSSGVDEKPKKRAAVAASSFDAIGFLIDAGVEQQTAADYLTLRKSKKAPATKTALSAIVREIGIARMAPQAVVEMCCSRGWVGFKAEWIDNQQARAGPQKPAKFDPVAHINRNRTRSSETADIIDITAERLA